MEKNVKIALLFEFYKELLTERERECIELHYNEDLSLSEIGENMGITRQGVRDNIKRGEKILLDTEQKLKLGEKFLNIKDGLERIDEIIAQIQNSPDVATLSDGIKHKINDILSIIMKMNDD